MRSGRPTVISAAMATRIKALSAKGLSHASIARVLTGDGHPVTRTTVGRFLARQGSAEGVAAPTDPAELEKATAAALDGDDDLAALERILAEVTAGMREWSAWVGTDPRATRAYATLARLAGELRSRAHELRPAPEVEHDRLSALGEAQRQALLERTRARAEVDYRARYERAMRLAGVEP